MIQVEVVLEIYEGHLPHLLSQMDALHGVSEKGHLDCELESVSKYPCKSVLFYIHTPIRTQFFEVLPQFIMIQTRCSSTILIRQQGGVPPIRM